MEDTSTTERRLETALAAWGPTASAGERLGGGFRNRVWAATVDGRRYAARRGNRPAAALAWELDLLDRLAGVGLRVPRPLPARDGRRAVDGLVLLSWLDGEPPATPRDWRAVAAALARLHALTRDPLWPQRPGWAATADLLTATAGGDVDLARMPAGAVARCRDAWRPLAAEPRAVVHGDPGAPNLRIGAGGEVGILDWDEARVDAAILDLAELPLDRGDLPVDTSGPITPARLAAARRAADAWEAANGWTLEPAYARRRLAAV